MISFVCLTRYGKNHHGKITIVGRKMCNLNYPGFQNGDTSSIMASIGTNKPAEYAMFVDVGVYLSYHFL